MPSSLSSLEELEWDWIEVLEAYRVAGRCRRQARAHGIPGAYEYSISGAGGDRLDLGSACGKVLEGQAMKIGFNACTLRGQGSSLVGRGILEALGEARSVRGDIAWVPQEWGGRLGSTIRTRTSKAGWAQKFITENWEIRRATMSKRIDALFSMGDTGTPRPGVPHLLLVQTAFLARKISDLEFPVSKQRRLQMRLMDWYFATGIGGVSKLTVQTEFMKLGISQRWGIDPARIEVIPSQIPGAKERRTPDDKVARLIYIASAAAHKGHSTLPKMLEVLSSRGIPRVRLVLTVARGDLPEFDRMADELKVTEMIEYRGAVQHAEALALLAASSVAVIPSRLESFGLTYFEAMSCGVPVVASDREFAWEACGDAALYAPPEDSTRWAEVVVEALDRRDELSRAGLERVERMKLGWPEIAQRYLKIIEEMR